MSSIPGYTLEDFISWNYDLIVEEMEDTNESLRIAEALGKITRRKQMTKEKFAELISTFFEPFRENVELDLYWFEEDEHSWRDYSSIVADKIPKDIFDKGLEWINTFFESQTKGNENATN